MSTGRFCVFYRNFKNLSMGHGIGYCDFDGDWVICKGDIKFCEKTDALNKYLFGKKKGETNKKALSFRVMEKGRKA